jgi:hypothetical protein
VARHTRFAGWAAAVGEALLAGRREVVVLDRPDLLETRAARYGTRGGRGDGRAAGRGPPERRGVRLPGLHCAGADHRA